MRAGLCRRSVEKDGEEKEQAEGEGGIQQIDADDPLMDGAPETGGDPGQGQELANIFNEIAFFLVMEGIPFKPLAYEKAAIMLENLEEDIECIYTKKGVKGFEEMPGIGKSVFTTILPVLLIGIASVRPLYCLKAVKSGRSLALSAIRLWLCSCRS